MTISQLYIWEEVDWRLRRQSTSSQQNSTQNIVIQSEAKNPNILPVNNNLQIIVITHKKIVL